MRHKLGIAAVCMCLLMPLAADAQKKSKKKVVQQPVVVVAEPTEEELNFDNFLSSTAKVCFVDSLVCPMKSITASIPLAKSAGSVNMTTRDGVNTYVYTNELGNMRIVSRVDSTKQHRLYKTTRKGVEWSEPELIEIDGDYTDVICPYMMPDGETLYFSAKGGDDNVGGYDLFFTVYDAEENKYITPQSLGLPFNSSKDDLYYIIDEDSKLGHLVTTRAQKDGNVCVYTFIPTETREVYNIDTEENEDLLRSYALIQSIKATQKGKSKEVALAQSRLKELRSSNVVTASTVPFPISKNVVYYRREDFKSEGNRVKYDEYASRMRTLREEEIHLSALRKGYRNGQTYTSNEILELEKSLEKEKDALKVLAEEMRRAEK